MLAKLLNNQSIDKNEWDAFVHQSLEGDFYALSGFLDVVKSGWNALMVTHQDQTEGIMPLPLDQRLFWKRCIQPLACRHTGILFANKDFEKDYQVYSFKNKVAKHIVDHMPSINHFVVHFSPYFDYPFPFYWNGYHLNTRYTYWLDLTKPVDQLNYGMRKENRKRIRQLEEAGYTFASETSVKEMVGLTSNLLKKHKNVVNQRQVNILRHVANFLVDEGLGKIHAIKDSKGKVISAGLVVYYKNKATLLMSGRSGKNDPQGIMTMMVWEMIKHASHFVDNFDFAGSMLPGIEPFNRGFGAKPISYLEIKKINYICSLYG